MAHLSAARTLNAVQAWRAQAQQALVVDAVGFQAGAGIGSERLAIELPHSRAEIDLGAVWMGLDRLHEHLLEKRAEGHRRGDEKGEGRAEHQVFFPVDVEHLHAMEIGLQVARRGAVFADRVNSHELTLLFLESGWSGAAAPPRPGVTRRAASRVVSVPAGAAGVPSFFQASQRRYSGEPTYSRLSTPIFRW